jgi:hypothetical protein
MGGKEEDAPKTGIEPSVLFVRTDHLFGHVRIEPR